MSTTPTPLEASEVSGSLAPDIARLCELRNEGRARSGLPPWAERPPRQQRPVPTPKADPKPKSPALHLKCEAMRRERERRGRLCEERFRNQLGERYRACSLKNYRIDSDAQRDAVDALKRYVADWPKRLAEGGGLVLFGPPGTGKDHLLAATGAEIARRYFARIVWVPGWSLFENLREPLSRDLADSMCQADVLVVSDPLPHSGPLVDRQAERLLRVVDARYTAMRPTWVSVNVASTEETNQRLGAALASRLRDNAMCLFCNWTDHRKPLSPEGTRP